MIHVCGKEQYTQSHQDRGLHTVATSMHGLNSARFQLSQVHAATGLWVAVCNERGQEALDLHSKHQHVHGVAVCSSYDWGERPKITH